MSERTGQPTEEPTARRWEKSFQDGELAFSTELVGGLIVLVAVLFFAGMGKWFFDSILISIRERLTYFQPMISDQDAVLLAIRRNVEQVGMACLGLMLPMSAVALAVGVMQTRFNISFKPLEWKWDKMSPKKGLKKIFSTRSLNRGGLSIAKTAAIVIAAYCITLARRWEVTYSGANTYGEMVEIGAELLLAIGFATAILLVVVGVADLAFQLWKQKKDLMMTKQEVKEESKESDGDPQVKARIRRIQGEMARKNVMQEVPKATVVITNPTHFAVALRYDTSESDAPVVIAKGADHLAKQIIKVAKENGVAVVERKPVARFLYANVKVGGQIPYELYQAVAEILNFIRKSDQAA